MLENPELFYSGNRKFVNFRYLSFHFFESIGRRNGRQGHSRQGHVLKRIALCVGGFAKMLTRISDDEFFLEPFWELYRLFMSGHETGVARTIGEHYSLSA